MSWLFRTLTSHTGRKALAALTGLGLVLFLITHLIGNLQIFGDGTAFNAYAHSLHDGPLIVIADIGLLIAFPLHIGLVIWLAMDNRKARGATGYRVSATKQKRSFAKVLASKSTLYGGVFLLVFVVAHVMHFRLRHEEIGPNLHGEILDFLSQPLWGGFYILGSLLVGWHIFHGFQAAFRSLGFHHGRYTPIIVHTGTGIAAIIALGFSAIPVWIMLSVGPS